MTKYCETPGYDGALAVCLSVCHSFSLSRCLSLSLSLFHSPCEREIHESASGALDVYLSVCLFGSLRLSLSHTHSLSLSLKQREYAARAENPTPHVRPKTLIAEHSMQVLTVHGRTRDEKGPEAPLADWDLIQKVLKPAF